MRVDCRLDGLDGIAPGSCDMDCRDDIEAREEGLLGNVFEFISRVGVGGGNPKESRLLGRTNMSVAPSF